MSVTRDTVIAESQKLSDKPLLSKSEGYIVYFGFVDDELVYIGKGSDGRECHLNTGASHVYEANELHFKGGAVDVVKCYMDSHEDVTKLEIILIKAFKPKWNKVYSVNNYKVYTKGRGEVKEHWIDKNMVLSLGSCIDSINKSNTERDMYKILYESLQEKLEQVREDLDNCLPEMGTLSTKEYAVMLLNRGFKTTYVAKEVGKSERTIQRWKKEMPS